MAWSWFVDPKSIRTVLSVQVFVNRAYKRWCWSVQAQRTHPSFILGCLLTHKKSENEVQRELCLSSTHPYFTRFSISVCYCAQCRHDCSFVARRRPRIRAIPRETRTGPSVERDAHSVPRREICRASHR